VGGVHPPAQVFGRRQRQEGWSAHPVPAAHDPREAEQVEGDARVDERMKRQAQRERCPGPHSSVYSAPFPLAGKRHPMATDRDRPSGPRRLLPTQDEQLLEAPLSVPDRRSTMSSDPWRVLRIMGEFVEGFDTLSTVKNGVTIFGSARVKDGDPQYHQAV